MPRCSQDKYAEKLAWVECTKALAWNSEDLSVSFLSASSPVLPPVADSREELYLGATLWPEGSDHCVPNRKETSLDFTRARHEDRLGLLARHDGQLRL